MRIEKANAPGLRHCLCRYITAALVVIGYSFGVNAGWGEPSSILGSLGNPAALSDVEDAALMVMADWSDGDGEWGLDIQYLREEATGLRGGLGYNRMSDSWSYGIGYRANSLLSCGLSISKSCSPGADDMTTAVGAILGTEYISLGGSVISQSRDDRLEAEAVLNAGTNKLKFGVGQKWVKDQEEQSPTWVGVELLPSPQTRLGYSRSVTELIAQLEQRITLSLGDDTRVILGFRSAGEKKVYSIGINFSGK